MRLLCKKDFKDLDEFNVTQGDVVYINQYIFGLISKKPNTWNGVNIDISTLTKHFMIYDELEYEDAYSAISMLLMMNYFDKESDLLEKIEDYIRSRRKYLCETEDTRQEQEKTETLHTTNQI